MVERQFPATIRQRGQVTIDKDVRDELDLGLGDYVILTVKPMERTNE